MWFRSQRMAAAASWCVQCTIHKNLHFLNSITRFVSAAGHVAFEVIFESPIASSAAVYWKALGTLVLSAAGRGVVQVEAHERCVLVQCCTVHKNLHFKNSIARLFRQLVMAREVIFESHTASPVRRVS